MSLHNHRYTAVAIGLHWAIAASIIGMIWLGWHMGDLPNDAPNKGDLYQLHKSIGISILVLTIARVVWRALNRPPEEPPMSHWQLVAARATHHAFYALMVLMPLTGWILVSASARGLPTILFDTINWPHLPFLPGLSTETKRAIHPLLENMHGKLAWVMIPLLVLHVAAALKHQFLDRDKLMARMLPGLFGRTDGPPAQGRGGVIAFGAALVFFLALAAIGILSAGAGEATPVKAPTPPASKQIEPNWVINMEESHIGFAGTHEGAPFKGEFTSWDAQIAFDPAAPADAGVLVTVNTGSAITGDTYQENSLKGPDFFNVKTYPQAFFKANGVHAIPEAEGGGLELTAVLTLKGVDYPVRMPFTLDIANDEAVMVSAFQLDRLALGIGVQNDPTADWVSQTIDMTIRVVANRTDG